MKAEYPAWLRKDGSRKHNAKSMSQDGVTTQTLEWHATIYLREVSLLHSPPVKGLGMMRYWVDINSEYWGMGSSKSTSYEQAVQVVNSFIRNYGIPPENMHWHNHTEAKGAQQFLFTEQDFENMEDE